MAAEGRVLANAYAGGPWGSPSRTALLTGRNAAHFAPLARDAQGRGTKFNPSVAGMLKTAGYATCALGKHDLSAAQPELCARAAAAFQQLAAPMKTGLPGGFAGFHPAHLPGRGVDGAGREVHPLKFMSHHPIPQAIRAK